MDVTDHNPNRDKQRYTPPSLELYGAVKRVTLGGSSGTGEPLTGNEKSCNSSTKEVGCEV